MSETKPFQIRIETQLLTALQELAPHQPGKQSGAGLLLRRLAALFVGQPVDDGEEKDLPGQVEDFLASEGEWEAAEVEMFVDDLLRFADRSRDKLEQFRALALVGKLELLLYRERQEPK